MSEFTKGPWKVSNNGTDIFVGGDSVLDIVCNVGWLRIKRDRANARLIATAPEMYEKLSDFIDNIESFLTVYDDSSIFYDKFHQLVKSTKELLNRIDGEKEK